ncbi:MAG TPA: hypothetical protein VGI74_20830 [Streptosporangiaceae bacterium]
MTQPHWTDEDLLCELGAALREEEEADAEFIRAAQMAFTWRNVDAELETIGVVPGCELAGAGRVRGAGQGAPRLLSFHGGQLSVELEVDETGMVGQLTPPGPGQVTLITADGPQATAQADEVGGFSLPPASGPIRLDCVSGAGHFITEWTTL